MPLVPKVAVELPTVPPSALVGILADLVQLATATSGLPSLGSRLASSYVRELWAGFAPLLRSTRVQVASAAPWARPVALELTLLADTFAPLCGRAIPQLMLPIEASTADLAMLEAAGVHTRGDARGLGHALVQLAMEMPLRAADATLEGAAATAAEAAVTATRATWTDAFDAVNEACIASISPSEMAAIVERVVGVVRTQCNHPERARAWRLAALLPLAVYTSSTWQPLRDLLRTVACVRCTPATGGGALAFCRPVDALLVPPPLSGALAEAIALHVGKRPAIPAAPPVYAGRGEAVGGTSCEISCEISYEVSLGAARLDMGVLLSALPPIFLAAVADGVGVGERSTADEVTRDVDLQHLCGGLRRLVVELTANEAYRVQVGLDVVTGCRLLQVIRRALRAAALFPAPPPHTSWSLSPTTQRPTDPNSCPSFCVQTLATAGMHIETRLAALPTAARMWSELFTKVCEWLQRQAGADGSPPADSLAAAEAARAAAVIRAELQPGADGQGALPCVFLPGEGHLALDDLRWLSLHQQLQLQQAGRTPHALSSVYGTCSGLFLQVLAIGTEPMTLYDILQVETTASPSGIAKSYRALCMLYHRARDHTRPPTAPSLRRYDCVPSPPLCSALR